MNHARVGKSLPVIAAVINASFYSARNAREAGGARTVQKRLTMNAQSLLAWWNLIFVVPFGLALLYLGLYATTGLGVGEVDADADAAADADADADGDADADHDADGGHASVQAAVLGFIGVGHVPVGFLLMAIPMGWGVTGFVVNQTLARRYGDGPRLAMASLPAAAVASLLMLRAIVAAVDRWLPLNASSARRRHELLGSAGDALFAINETFGLASVRDDRGELYQVPCRVEPGAAALPKGARVRLVAYSGTDKSFFVRPLERGQPRD